MTSIGDAAETFGPYHFTLSPAEREAAAARFGLRSALRGRLIANQLAPLTAFVLVLLFASILALTELISRRFGEEIILLAAVAYMIQRLVTLRLLAVTRNRARAAMLAGLETDGASTAWIDRGGVTLNGGRGSRRLDYVDCEEAEDAFGLIHLWPRSGAPIVLPARELGVGEAERLVAYMKKRVAENASARHPPIE